MNGELSEDRLTAFTAYVRFGSEADVELVSANVRLVPIADVRFPLEKRAVA